VHTSKEEVELRKWGVAPSLPLRNDIIAHVARSTFTFRHFARKPLTLASLFHDQPHPVNMEQTNTATTTNGGKGYDAGSRGAMGIM
jgi:hypothetical protein